MYPIPVESGSQWSVDKGTNKSIPASIQTDCPHCHAKTAFPSTHTHRTHFGTITFHAPCPACGGLVLFVMAYSLSSKTEEPRKPESIVIHPDPKPKRKPIPGIEHVPERIRDHYTDAIDAVNHGLHSPSVTAARIALEAICFDKLKIDKESTNKSLAEMLKRIPPDEIIKPLMEIPDGVREVGNLGSHFKRTPAIGQHVAEMNLEFLEYFLEYLYVLPHRVKHLLAEAEKTKSEVETSKEIGYNATGKGSE